MRIALGLAFLLALSGCGSPDGDAGEGTAAGRAEAAAVPEPEAGPVDAATPITVENIGEGLTPSETSQTFPALDPLTEDLWFSVIDDRVPPHHPDRIARNVAAGHVAVHHVLVEDVPELDRDVVDASPDPSIFEERDQEGVELDVPVTVADGDDPHVVEGGGHGAGDVRLTDRVGRGHQRDQGDEGAQAGAMDSGTGSWHMGSRAGVRFWDTSRRSTVVPAQPSGRRSVSRHRTGPRQARRPRSSSEIP